MTLEKTHSCLVEPIVYVNNIYYPLQLLQATTADVYGCFYYREELLSFQKMLCRASLFFCS